MFFDVIGRFWYSKDMKNCTETKTTDKHCGTKIELVKHLSDEDVSLDDFFLVDVLDAA